MASMTVTCLLDEMHIFLSKGKSVVDSPQAIDISRIQATFLNIPW